MNSAIFLLGNIHILHHEAKVLGHNCCPPLLLKTSSPSHVKERQPLKPQSHPNLSAQSCPLSPSDCLVHAGLLWLMSDCGTSELKMKSPRVSKLSPSLPDLMCRTLYPSLVLLISPCLRRIQDLCGAIRLPSRGHFFCCPFSS